MMTSKRSLGVNSLKSCSNDDVLVSMNSAISYASLVVILV